MSQMTIDCPQCASPLLVPEAAAGRKARCTKCSVKFIIPSVEEMLEQTITHFALGALDERWHEAEESAAEEAEAKAKANGKSKKKRRSERPESPEAGGTIMGVPVDTEPARSGGGRDDAVLGVDRVDPPRPQPETADANAKADAPREEKPPGYPQELNPPKPRPYLVVREATMKGILLAFDAVWLKSEAFRLSMPKRCVTTGRGVEANLHVRPMIFHNTTKGDIQHIHQLETKYARPFRKGDSARQHMKSIGRVEEMPSPFDRPMLFYTTSTSSSDPLHSVVHTGDEGSRHCEVLIPHAEVALQWLERVNGICGVEHALLRGDVANLSSDAWLALPEATRRRLEVWARFQRGERLKVYLNDADMSSADEGLAGVIVTDQRLLYHKYRLSRSISLKQEGVLHVRADDKVARLTLQSFGRTARAGKIRRSDMNRLVEALADAPRLRVMVGKADATEPVGA